MHFKAIPQALIASNSTFENKVSEFHELFSVTLYGGNQIQIYFWCKNIETYDTEVFKLWVGTQTCVKKALSLGCGPFCDPQNKIKMGGKPQTYHCKQTTTKLFCTVWIKITKITPKILWSSTSSPLYNFDKVTFLMFWVA